MFENQLKELLKLTNTENMNQLANHFGIKNSLVANWKKNGRIPEKYLLQAKNDELKTATNQQINEIQHTININSTQIQIPIFTNQYASAGNGIDNYDEECEVFVFNKFELKAMFNLNSLKNLRLIKVSGNSMCPTINEGEMVLFQADGREHEGSIYIVRYYDEVFIKRLFKRPKLMLKSDNKDYEPIVINEDEEIEILGRVVGSINIGYKRF